VAEVFIYCDKHNTRAPVTDFDRIDGRWTEIGRDSTLRLSTGEQSRRGIVLTGPDNHRADTYRRYDLRCRKRRCRHSVVVREANLFGALDGFAAAGVSSIPLRLLAASLKHVTSESDP
jgi:hypothetical protein